MTNFLVLAWMLIVPMTAGDPTPRAKPTGEEKAVHAAHDNFVKAWNAHDAAALAALWVKDGDHTEPDGRTVFGQTEVQRLNDLRTQERLQRQPAQPRGRASSLRRQRRRRRGRLVRTVRALVTRAGARSVPAQATSLPSWSRRKVNGWCRRAA